MKLLTLNCHAWREAEQLDKIKILAKFIEERKYDVIALQEVSQLMSSKILYNNIRQDNYVECLIKELNRLGINDYSYVWDFAHIGYDIYEEGIAILTRHTIKNYHSFYVSNDTSISNYKSRKVLKATIDINGTEYEFYNCHLGWWNDDEEPFKEQVDKLFQVFNKARINFVMGDFNNNAFVRNEGYDYLIVNGLIDTYTISKEKDDGITVSGEIDGWKNSKERKRLDLILCNKELEVINSKVVLNDKSTLVSDHFGVEVIINKSII